MSFILGENSIGHLAKSTSRANTILSQKVDIRKALHMFARTSEDFLQGVHKSLVHNIIIDFAHGGDIVRSNCQDRSNPKNNTAPNQSWSALPIRLIPFLLPATL